ncbi:MAG: ATP cone domain-containing protein [Candidatus Vogelbacteria bacterium]|nr:ATP cone domain-containing protein [Candidatus Vogelbacteria bacterium]
MAKKQKIVRKIVKKVKSEKKETRNPLVVKQIQKRDGTRVPYDEKKVASAIFKAMKAAGEGSLEASDLVAKSVLTELLKICLAKGAKTSNDCIPAVEDIQDVVERQLIVHQFAAAAKNYILYREKRNELRRERGEVPTKVRELATESKKYFQNDLSEFIYYRSYSRWIDEAGRRETWMESVDRYLNFMKENIGTKLKEAEYDELRGAMLAQKVMPSMRLMWSAGPAARKTNVTGYNCTYLAPTTFQDLAEVMYLSMSGCGVGFSVESQTAQQFPIVQRQSGKIRRTHVVEDSREGWCDALVIGLKAWFAGEDITFDYSQLRPAGARLKTMGGRSSGPEPLVALMIFVRGKVLTRQGKRLRNIDLHDIICKIGEVVVSGGVRRTAMISISDLDDDLIQHAKDGQFYMTEPQRSLANNTAVYNEKPSSAEFLSEWISLMKSGSGERGIFNRGSLQKQLPKRRWEKFEKDAPTCGMNPCGEIVLKSKQFCNLTEVVARAGDTEEDLLAKARLASILGTYQASLTHFPYLSEECKENCEEEALLGVSITGQWDCKMVRNPEMMRKMKDEAVRVNKEYAKRFGVNRATAVTCVKPSGTVSQLVDSSSGMHPRHAKYYIRRIRISATDALFKMMKDQGCTYYPEVGQMMDSANTYVLEFPVKAPENSIYKDDQSAIDQLEYWKMVKENYTEHNPSVTISIGDEEWVETANWIYKNWDLIGGLSFLPRSNHVYKLAPYEEVMKERYDEMVKNFPELDFSKIVLYEVDDQTQGAKELACSSGVCEIDMAPTSEEKSKK